MRRRVFVTGASASLAWVVARPALAKGDVGFILIGASWCGVCKRAAPVLAALAQPGGLPVLVVTEDGKPSAPFPSAIGLDGHPLGERVRRYPTTLIYSGRSDTVIDEIVGYRNARTYAERLARGVRLAEGIG